LLTYTGIHSDEGPCVTVCQVTQTTLTCHWLLLCMLLCKMSLRTAVLSSQTFQAKATAS